MTQRDTLDPNSEGYTNALLEDIDDKFQTVLEATAPIPKLQEDVAELKEVVGDMQPRLQAVEEVVTDMQPKVDATFEEVGALRKDVDIMKEALKLLDRHDDRMTAIERRLAVVEQRRH